MFPQDRRLARRQQVRRNRAVAFSGLLLFVLLVVGGWRVWQSIAEQRRIDAAWKRVGKCSAVGNTAQVTCTGVKLELMSLPKSIGACRDGIVCEVKVNHEARKAFEASLAEVVRLGYGSHVTQFNTLNRRRCKDAQTGAWKPNCISKHSYGIAVDIRPFEDNKRWDAVIQREPALAEVVQIFRNHGFRWGGTFANYDPQHLEWMPR